MNNKDFSKGNEKEKICDACLSVNGENSLYCSKCGKKLKSEQNNKKTIVMVMSLVVILCVLIVSLLLILNPLKYKYTVSKGYKTLNEGKYEKAIELFEEAILKNEKKAEAYIGKATAITYSSDNEENIWDKVFNVLDVGYEKSGEREILDFKESLKEKLEGGGSEGGSDEIPTEKTLISDFEKAEDFYIEWIYGQFYADGTDVSEKGGKYKAFVSGTDINTKEKLENEIKKHFSEKLSQIYIKELNPEDVDGKLRINIKMGVGDSGFMITGYETEKISDTEYILTITEENVMVEGNTKISKLKCTPKNGKWVFENYGSSEHFEEKMFNL